MWLICQKGMISRSDLYCVGKIECRSDNSVLMFRVPW